MKVLKKSTPAGIWCPSCRKASFIPHETGGKVICSACGYGYPVKNGYIDLLLERPGNIPSIDVSMEWKWLIKIYETPLWRRNLLLSSMFGISFQREQKRILAAAELNGSDIVLDLACGPGIYTRALAKLVNQGYVTGLDLSAPMLTYAVAKARKEGVENVQFLRGNAMDLPFVEYSFDLVNCCGALHLFPEIEKVAASVFKTLKPGGRFTGAAARNPGGMFSKKLVAAAEKKHGLTYFFDHRMGSLLKDAGFEDVRFLHNKNFWLMFCARKRME